MPKVLLTGMAGFIGFHLAVRLIREGFDVLGIDNLNDYYDPALKRARLMELGFPDGKIRKSDKVISSNLEGLHFMRMDLADRNATETLFENESFNLVVHLAAQPGARASLTEPYRYINSNILGFIHVLEGVRNHPVDHFVYASSSSVYGGNEKQPYTEEDRVDTPVSLYAATKRSNELMAYTYSHLFGVPTTGLRFFTVYGPWGRPDMAYFKFVKSILEGHPVEVYNEGNLERDFTYIDDIVEGIYNVTGLIPTGTPPCQLFNIGHSVPVNLLYFIKVIEDILGKKAIKKLMPMQAGDVRSTCADSSRLEKYAGFKPVTPIEEGMKLFVEWFRSYHR